MNLNKDQLNSYYFGQILRYAKTHKDGFIYDDLKSFVLTNEFKKSIHDDVRSIKAALEFWFNDASFGFKNLCRIEKNKNKQFFFYCEDKI